MFNLAKANHLRSAQPKVADVVCRCYVTFAEFIGIDLGQWNVSTAADVKPPLDLLPMAAAESSSTTMP